MKRLNAEIEQEIRLANKALTKVSNGIKCSFISNYYHSNISSFQVRRERLKHLLDNEWDEYRRELNELGLTFHNERK